MTDEDIEWSNDPRAKHAKEVPLRAGIGCACHEDAPSVGRDSKSECWAQISHRHALTLLHQLMNWPPTRSLSQQVLTNG